MQYGRRGPAWFWCCWPRVKCQRRPLRGSRTQAATPPAVGRTRRTGPARRCLPRPTTRLISTRWISPPNSTVTLDGSQSANALNFSDTNTSPAASWIINAGSPTNSTLTLGGARKKSAAPSAISVRAFVVGKARRLGRPRLKLSVRPEEEAVCMDLWRALKQKGCGEGIPRLRDGGGSAAEVISAKLGP